MANLMVKKGNNEKQQHHESLGIDIMKLLPKEMLVEIMGKVASTSTLDLFKIKLTCKDLLDAADDDYVFQHAAFDVLALVPLPWFKREQESSFLRRCKENGNLEVLYREGMVQYFTSLDGIHNLKKAALEGHFDAKYVYSLLLMSSEEDETERNCGFDLFLSLKMSACIVRCRKRVKGFIRNMWMNNPVVPNQRRLYLCRSNTCDRPNQKHTTTTRWSSLDDEDCDISVSCDYCCADYEFGLFCNMFRL